MGWDDAGAFLAIGGRFHRQKAAADTGQEPSALRFFFFFIFGDRTSSRGEGRVHGVRSS
jgi:hypothetical protein